MKLTRMMSCVLIASAALASCAATPPERSPVRVGVAVRVAPPPARVLVIPPPRRGYVWAPGYWRWNGHRYMWIDGRWLRERRGHAWVEDRWEDRGGDWVYVRSHWVRR
jgi:hypothetical protein